MTLAAFPIQLAIQSAAIAALGLLAERLLRSRGAPARQAALFGSILMLLAAPPAIGASSALHLGLWSTEAPPAHAAGIPGHALAPVPVQAGTSPARGFPWAILPPTLWGAGVLVSLLVLCRGLALTRGLLNGLRPARDPRLDRAAEWAAERLALPFPPRVGVSGRAPVPFAAGILRPTVVLPEFMEGTSDETALRAILLHEEAHLLHRHPLSGFLQRLAGALYWWNPLVRLLNERLADCQEEVCDNHVLEAQGSGHRLASCLLDLAERAAGIPTPAAAFPLFRDEPGFESRVKGLLAGKERRTMTRLTLKEAVLSAGFFLAVLGAMLGCTPASAEPEAKEKDKKETPAKAEGILTIGGTMTLTTEVYVLKKGDGQILYVKEADAKDGKTLALRRVDAGEGAAKAEPALATVTLRVEEGGKVKAEPTLSLRYGEAGRVKVDGLSLDVKVTAGKPPQVDVRLEIDGKPAGEFSLSAVPGRTSVVSTPDRKISITLK